MGTSKINKSELFKVAWLFFNSGDDSFSDCLKTAWNHVRGIVTNGVSKESSVSDIKECVYLNAGSTDSEWILSIVKTQSKGFQKDIANKGLSGINLSEKQSWCVAYEFKNVA